MVIILVHVVDISVCIHLSQKEANVVGKTSKKTKHLNREREVQKSEAISQHENTLTILLVIVT